MHLRRRTQLIIYSGIDSTLATGFGHSTAYGASALTNLITISFIGGLPFILLASALGILFYKSGSRNP